MLPVAQTLTQARSTTVGFDTSVAGTPESCWDTVPRPPWCPEEGPLVVVAPHPDDETLGVGGLIYTWARRRLPITLLVVTAGEAACPEIANLADVRHAEFRAALNTLTADHARVIRLGIPDGKVRNHQARLSDTLTSVISKGTTVIAPFEHDGHTDHDAAGEVAREVTRSADIALAAYPIWAWHQATPSVFSGRRIVSFSLSPAARAAKQAAIQCYGSQLRQRPGGPIVPAHVVSYFTRTYEGFLL